MRNWLILLFMLVTIQNLPAQTVKSNAYNLLLKGLLKHNVPEVDVKDITRIKNEEIVFLDSRTKKEYDVSHIEDAVWVGFEEFNIKKVKHIPKNQKIVVYCSVGYRSEKITQKLKDAGYKDVSNLYGGVFEWVNEDHPVVNNNNKKTNKVHGYSKSWGIWLRKGDKAFD